MPAPRLAEDAGKRKPMIKRRGAKLAPLLPPSPCSRTIAFFGRVVVTLKPQGAAISSRSGLHHLHRFLDIVAQERREPGPCLDHVSRRLLPAITPALVDHGGNSSWSISLVRNRSAALMSRRNWFSVVVFDPAATIPPSTAVIDPMKTT